MKAVKGNKEYIIDESQKKAYQDTGFDIMGGDGEMIAYGRGKTVPYEDHMDAVREIGRLQELLSAVQKEKAELEKTVDELKSVQEKGKTTVKKASE